MLPIHLIHSSSLRARTLAHSPHPNEERFERFLQSGQALFQAQRVPYEVGLAICWVPLYATLGVLRARLDSGLNILKLTAQVYLVFAGHRF